MKKVIVKNDLTFENEQEKPGWVWLLTLEQGDLDTAQRICGCYATKELMLDDMKKMGKARYDFHHILVEGWKQ